MWQREGRLTFFALLCLALRLLLSTLRWYRATSVRMSVDHGRMHHLRAAWRDPELICDEGLSAVSLQRVALPHASKLAATAEFHYRLGGCSVKRNRGGGLTGSCCVSFIRDQRHICHQRQPNRTVESSDSVDVPLKEMQQHVATHILTTHTSFPMPAGSAALLALPPLKSRRQGVCRLASVRLWIYPIRIRLVLPFCNH
jgi:hypothetical protein